MTIAVMAVPGLAPLTELIGQTTALSDALDELEGVAAASRSAMMSRITAAWRARLALARGDMSEALQWAATRENPKTDSDEGLEFPLEFEYLMLARLEDRQGTVARRAGHAGTRAQEGGGGGEDGQCHRDPGSAGHHPAGARQDRRSHDDAAEGALAGGTRGVRARLRGRGRADGRAAAVGAGTANPARLRVRASWRRLALRLAGMDSIPFSGPV